MSPAPPWIETSWRSRSIARRMNSTLPQSSCSAFWSCSSSQARHPKALKNLTVGISVVQNLPYAYRLLRSNPCILQKLVAVEEISVWTAALGCSYARKMSGEGLLMGHANVSTLKQCGFFFLENICKRRQYWGTLAPKCSILAPPSGSISPSINRSSEALFQTNPPLLHPRLTKNTKPPHKYTYYSSYVPILTLCNLNWNALSLRSFFLLNLKYSIASHSMSSFVSIITDDKIPIVFSIPSIFLRTKHLYFI